MRHASCPHFPACPSPTARDRDAARIACNHPEQGWSLLCNGVVVFEDTGEILPDERTLGTEPRRNGASRSSTWAGRPRRPARQTGCQDLGAGSLIAMPMLARSTGVPRWRASRSWCSQSL